MSHALSGSLRWDVIIRWDTSPPVTAGTESLWIFWTSVDPTPEGFRYILVIADYFSKWTEAFPMKNKCADTVADILVEKIILRFGMPLVIHSDQGREFENGLMKSLCALLGCTEDPHGPLSSGIRRDD